MKKNILLLSVLLGLFACQNNTQMIDASKSSIQGVYKGVFPCADCSGIETTLTLNADKSFEKIDKYLGENKGSFTEKGSFSTTDDHKLITKSAAGEMAQYAIKNNKLILLDKDGKESTSSLSNEYQLNKIK